MILWQVKWPYIWSIFYIVLQIFLIYMIHISTMSSGTSIHRRCITKTNSFCYVCGDISESNNYFPSWTLLSFIILTVKLEIRTNLGYHLSVANPANMDKLHGLKARNKRCLDGLERVTKSCRLLLSLSNNYIKFQCFFYKKIKCSNILSYETRYLLGLFPCPSLHLQQINILFHQRNKYFQQMILPSWSLLKTMPTVFSGASGNEPYRNIRDLYLSKQ